VRHLEGIAVFVTEPTAGGVHGRPGTCIDIAEEAHLPFHHPETVHAAILFTAFHQRLHADADGQQRLVTADFRDYLVDAQPANLCHAVTNGAHAREDDVVGLQNVAASLVTVTDTFRPTYSSALATECRLPIP
jgi:hypothetical protein